MRARNLNILFCNHCSLKYRHRLKLAVISHIPSARCACVGTRHIIFNENFRSTDRSHFETIINNHQTLVISRLKFLRNPLNFSTILMNHNCFSESKYAKKNSDTVQWNLYGSLERSWDIFVQWARMCQMFWISPFTRRRRSSFSRETWVAAVYWPTQMVLIGA